MIILFILIDPLSQLDKAKDASSKHDLKAIQASLDAYYNDHGCYPTTLPFGSQWKEGATVYMRTVPQSGSCKNNSAMCYLYQTDSTNSCPQWNILYAKQKKISAESACMLSGISSSCIPPNYDSNWACTFSGVVDCNIVASNPVLPNSSTSTGGNDGNQNNYPPEESCPQSERRYACTGGPVARCNEVPRGMGRYCTPSCANVCE